MIDTPTIEVPRAAVDAAVRRPGPAVDPQHPVLEPLADARVLLRINAAVGPRQAHSDLALRPDHGIAARYGRIGDALAETARIETTGADGLEQLIQDSLPEDPVLRAPARLSPPGMPVLEVPEAADRLLIDRRLNAAERARMLADQGVEPALIDVLCAERARVSATLQVRDDATSADPDTGWTGLWVLGTAGLYALRAAPDTGRTAFQQVAPGDVMQQLVGRVASSFHYLGALDRERARGTGDTGGEPR